MKYQFLRPDQPSDPQYFIALMLNRKKMKERILIGSKEEIQSLLRGYQEADIICDIERPIGTLLTEFEQDTKKAWNEFGTMPLWEAMHTNRFRQPELERIALDFLRAKYELGTPLEKYAAIRVWDGYARARVIANRESAADAYMRDMGGVKELFLYAEKRDILMRNKKKRIETASFDTQDYALDLWYPSGGPDNECVFAYKSLTPLVIYYQRRISEWQYFFQKCSVCGRYFLAPSQRYSICSEACRKAQARKSKSEFDDRARSNQYDMIYKNVCQRWRNRMNKAKRIGLPEDRLAEMQQAFKTFKTAALEKKNQVKSRDLTLMEYQNWLDAQDVILNQFV